MVHPLSCSVPQTLKLNAMWGFLRQRASSTSENPHKSPHCTPRYRHIPLKGFSQCSQLIFIAEHRNCWSVGCCTGRVRFSNEPQERSQKMKSIEVRQKLTYWQGVFLQSKVNGASYHGEALPGQVWSWPKNTYFQRRLLLRQDLCDNGPHLTQRDS